MSSFGSMALAVTGIEMSYISHSHCTCLPTSSRPLLFVNQNFVVTSGSMNASKISSTRLRMSMPTLVVGAFLIFVSFIPPPLSQTRTRYFACLRHPLDTSWIPRDHVEGGQDLAAGGKQASGVGGEVLPLARRLTGDEV